LPPPLHDAPPALHGAFPRRIEISVPREKPDVVDPAVDMMRDMRVGGHGE